MNAHATRPAEEVAPPTLAGKSLLTIPGEQWKLLWDDEFDGDHLDPAKWTSGLSWGGDDGTGRHHNDQYASYITDDNIVLHDGLLELLTRKQDVTSSRGKVYHYTQAFIQTQGKFQYTYGYCEVRVKVPVDAGPGLWPAFWMLSKGWPPEDDVAEFWTGRPKPHTHQGFAYRSAAGKVAWNSRHIDQIAGGFHTFGMEWGPGYQIFNRDGTITLRVYGAKVPAVPMYLILNSGVTAKPTRPTEQTVFPNAFVVDYVRVYARPPVIAIHNTGFESESLAPWHAWNAASIVRDHARTGQQALRVTGALASAEQTIFGLKPHTTYRLTGWADTASGDEARIGIKEFGAEEKYASTTNSGYRPLSVEFTTGAEATTAIIYCFKPSGAGEAYFDDVSVTEAPPPDSN